MAKLSLLLCCLRDEENNLSSTPLKFIPNSIKKKQWNRSAKSLKREAGSTLLRTIFELFFQEFCYKPIGLFKRGGRVPKTFFFEKPDETMSLFRSAIQSTLLKHAGEVFFVLGNADFFKFINVSELFWGKVLLIRVLYREQIMCHGWSVTLT